MRAFNLAVIEPNAEESIALQKEPVRIPHNYLGEGLAFILSKRHHGPKHLFVLFLLLDDFGFGRDEPQILSSPFVSI
jgi:hypothetical protein